MKWIDLSDQKQKLIEKLALDPKIDHFQLNIAKEGLLKFGKLSVPYLMRKLKCSVPTANALIRMATSDN